MENIKERRVFILEEKVKIKPSGYDHVFSFFSNPADSFPQDYISDEELHAFYDSEFHSFLDYWDHFGSTRSFYYREVDLVWCFKKGLIEFAFNIRIRYEIIRRVMAAFPHAQFYFQDTEEILEYPGLIQILKQTPLSNSSQIHPLNQTAFVATQRLPCKAKFIRFWPTRLTLGDLSRARVAIFSDYEKSKSVLQKIRSSRPVLYTHTPSPRSAMRAIQNHSVLYQAAYGNSAESRSCEKEAEVYRSRILREGLFCKYSIGEVKGGILFQKELERLFQQALPKLLFEIDDLHSFFQKARSLQTALLDEDSSPTKSAFCQVARYYGIRTFVECHGALARKNGVLPLSADFILAWGEAQKGKLLSWRCPEEKILVTGCSRYQRYQAMEDHNVRHVVCRRLGLNPNKKLILLAPTSISIGRGRWIFEDKLNRNMAQVLDALNVILDHEPEFQLIIKVHPGDVNKNRYDEWTQKHFHKARIVLVEKLDPLFLAKAVDFMIVYSSTYAMEGFALEKPVIYLFADEDQLLTEMREFGVLIYPKDITEFKAWVFRLLQGNQPKSLRWREARQKCLNEGAKSPDAQIADFLTDSQDVPRF